MTEIRHIVFDLGNVLLRWNPELPYLRLIPDPAARKRFLADICNGDWLIETDRGMGWPEAEAALIARHPDEAEMIRAFRRHWHEMAPGLVEGTRVFSAGNRSPLTKASSSSPVMPSGFAAHVLHLYFLGIGERYSVLSNSSSWS